MMFCHSKPRDRKPSFWILADYFCILVYRMLFCCFLFGVDSLSKSFRRTRIVFFLQHGSIFLLLMNFGLEDILNSSYIFGSFKLILFLFTQSQIPVNRSPSYAPVQAYTPPSRLPQSRSDPKYLSIFCSASTTPQLSVYFTEHRPRHFRRL